MPETHKEWNFDFCLSASSGEPVNEQQAEALMDKIVEWAEQKNLYVGGGFVPVKEEVDVKKDT